MASRLRAARIDRHSRFSLVAGFVVSQLIPPVFLRAHSQALLNDLTTDKPRQQVIESRNLNRFSLNSLTQSVFHRISRLQCRYKTSPAFCGRKKKVRRWPTSSSSAPSSSSCRKMEFRGWQLTWAALWYLLSFAAVLSAPLGSE